MSSNFVTLIKISETAEEIISNNSDGYGDIFSSVSKIDTLHYNILRVVSCSKKFQIGEKLYQVHQDLTKQSLMKSTCMHMDDIKTCLKWLTSFKVFKIFSKNQGPWQFQYFQSIFVKRDNLSDLTDNEICLALVQNTICH